MKTRNPSLRGLILLVGFAANGCIDDPDSLTTQFNKVGTETLCDLATMDAMPVDPHGDMTVSKDAGDGSSMMNKDPDMAVAMMDLRDMTDPPDLTVLPDLIKADLTVLPPDMVMVLPALAANNPFNNGNDDQIFGATNNIKSAQSFVPLVGGALMKIRVQLKKINGPADGVVIKVYAGGNTPEAGALVATSNTVSAANIQVTNQVPGPVVDFNFPGMVMLTKGGSYYFVVQRTGGLDPNEVNVYRIGNSGDKYPDGHAWTQWKTNDAAGWQALDFSKLDLTFEVVVQP